jgi:hypothetical protein
MGRYDKTGHIYDMSIYGRRQAMMPRHVMKNLMRKREG